MRFAHGAHARSSFNAGQFRPTVEGMHKTWLITGASRGFGRLWAEAALERGDRVALTARRRADVDDLAARFGADQALALDLDVRDRDAAFAALGRRARALRAP
jgi:NADP-dependent 3-hydroxy acid dehydrogenase YdfG